MLSSGFVSLPECSKNGRERSVQERMSESLAGNMRMGSPAGSVGNGLCPVDGVELLLHKRAQERPVLAV